MEFRGREEIGRRWAVSAHEFIEIEPEFAGRMVQSVDFRALEKFPFVTKQDLWERTVSFLALLASARTSV